MKRLIVAAVAAVAAILPAVASADYLYSMLPAERQPRVLFMVDNTSTIDSTEVSSIKFQLKSLLPRLDGVAAGFSRFGTVSSQTCQVGQTLANYTASRDAATSWVDGLTSGGNYNLGAALTAAKSTIASIAKSDTSVSCRPYVIVLITGGRGNTRCDSSKDSDSAIKNAVQALRDIDDGSLKDFDVPTFVIRYGDNGSTAIDSLGNLISGSTIQYWDEVARLGGRALQSNGTICKTGSCSSGTAFYARDGAELRITLNRILSEILDGEYSAIAPVIGTAPQVDSEVNRVARNFMAYTSFRMPGSEGHLYGIRLFVEESPKSGKWKFTNFYDLDLTTCGQADNPCVFDAGQKLVSRVGTRNIFTSISGSPRYYVENGANSGVTLPLGGTRKQLSADATGNTNFKQAWTSYVTLVNNESPVAAYLPTNTATLDDDTTTGDTDRRQVIDWLQGTSRQWPLGDLYHGGATVIGPAGYAYRTRGYPEFARKVKNRPHMIYVGANDGMVHAFHAAPKLTYQDEDETITQDWEAGDEAWAYLPVSMLARASSAIRSGENRFFSMDLSCRVDDVLTFDNMASGVLDCGTDPYCGWRTVVVCGQGWGGSWYVALDVTDPLAPKPMWESTYTGPKGLGRTWTVPGISLINEAGMPRWIGVMGNGYNADLQCKGVDCSSKREAFRLFNLPFDGLFPQHGNGASGESNGRLFFFDMATGNFLAPLDGISGPVVADTPVIDSNFDGWTDSALIGTWKSQVDHVLFGRDASNRFKPNLCADVGSFSGSTNKPITSRPSALPSIVTSGVIHAFVGAGVDGGSYPDEQGSSGNQYAFDIFDVNANSCGGRTSTLCSSTTGVRIKSIFSDGSRMVGSPLFVIRKDGERWLTFTSWLPPSVNQPCAESEATLRCLETSGNTVCRACGDLDGDGTPDSQTDLDTGGRQPTSPTSADGQLYVTTPYGPVRVANQSGEGGGVSGGLPQPNQGAPVSALVLGWREVFN